MILSCVEEPPSAGSNLELPILWMKLTLTPLFFILRTSQTPDLRLKLELGQWDTPELYSLIKTLLWKRPTLFELSENE